MLPAEVFCDAIYNGHVCRDRCEPYESYWLIEMAIADTAGIDYTNLINYGDDSERTCDICGTVYGTTAYGLLPECSHPVCDSLRKYWQYGPELRRPSRVTGNWKKDEVRRTRVNWFTKAIKDKFGVSTIFQLEPAIRLDALLTLRLLREAHEHQHQPCRTV